MVIVSNDVIRLSAMMSLDPGNYANPSFSRLLTSSYLTLNLNLYINLPNGSYPPHVTVSIAFIASRE